MRNLLVYTLFTLCLGACAPGHNDYSGFANIEPEGWSYGDTIALYPSINDSTATGTIHIALRHNNYYQYSNIWLEISHQQCDSSLQCDTLNIQLADIYGTWFGSGIGSSYQLEAQLQDHYQLTKDKPVLIRHIMRTDTLCGIDQIGIIFHANENPQ